MTSRSTLHVRRYVVVGEVQFWLIEIDYRQRGPKLVSGPYATEQQAKNARQRALRKRA